MKRYAFKGFACLTGLILLLLCCHTIQAEEKPDAVNTPVSEREQLLNKRLSFVENRKALMTDIERIESEIKSQKTGRPGSVNRSTPSYDPPKSLTKVTWIIVLLNFLVLSIFMIVRHQIQEPK